jgi:hypothetical protein
MEAVLQASKDVRECAAKLAGISARAVGLKTGAGAEHMASCVKGFAKAFKLLMMHVPDLCVLASRTRPQEVKDDGTGT